MCVEKWKRREGEGKEKEKGRGWKDREKKREVMGEGGEWRVEGVKGGKGEGVKKKGRREVEESGGVKGGEWRG